MAKASQGRNSGKWATPEKPTKEANAGVDVAETSDAPKIKRAPRFDPNAPPVDNSLMVVEQNKEVVLRKSVRVALDTLESVLLIRSVRDKVDPETKIRLKRLLPELCSSQLMMEGEAAKMVGITWGHIQEWKAEDETFRLDMESAHNENMDTIEGSYMRRGIDRGGVDGIAILNGKRADQYRGIPQESRPVNQIQIVFTKTEPKQLDSQNSLQLSDGNTIEITHNG